MPLYEFRCNECAKISEFQLKMADPYPTLCPACGQNGLQKIMSLPSFQLKGSGWYKDSYDGKSNKKPEPAKTEAAPAADAAATGKANPAAPAAAPAPASSAPTPAPSSPAKSKASDSSQ